MYLDWRGLAGTAAVHAGMILSPLGPVWGLGTPVCLCDVPGIEPMNVFDVPAPRILASFPLPTAGDGLGGLRLGLQKSCGERGVTDRSPVLLAPLVLSSASAGAGPLTLCVLVNADGSTQQVRITETGGRAAGAMASIKRAVKASRFEPARRDGVPVAGEVELRLVAG